MCVTFHLTPVVTGLVGLYYLMNWAVPLSVGN